MFLFCCFIVESHTLHWRRWAFMPRDEAFMPSVPNYGLSDGYHMHNIVVSHGVGYVYVWVVWRWVFNWLTMMNCLVMFCIMQIWCDDIFILMWINYGDVGFMPISWGMMMFLCCVVLLSSHIHFISEEGFHAKRWWLLCQAMMAFMPREDRLYAKCP